MILRYIYYSGLRGTPLTWNESHELALLFAARSPDPALPGDESAKRCEDLKLAEPTRSSSSSMIEVRLASQDATATAGRPCATCGCLFVVISSMGQAIPGLPQALLKDRGTAAFNVKKHCHCYSFTVS